MNAAKGYKNQQPQHQLLYSKHERCIGRVNEKCASTTTVFLPRLAEERAYMLHANDAFIHETRRSSDGSCGAELNLRARTNDT